MGANYVIEIKDMSKKFGKQQVLDKVNITCNKGDIIGIIGRNGSGKSVLLKCICGFLQPDEGEISICGKKNIEFMQNEHKLGAIIETPAFLNNYTGLRNLSLLYGILNQVDRSYLKAILHGVGLNPYSKKLVKKYSMGMKQRLAIAQAIMENQDILLLDEPLNSLDDEGVDRCRKIFLRLQSEGKTIMLTTHNKEDVEKLCNCVYEIKEGKLKQLCNV